MKMYSYTHSLTFIEETDYNPTYSASRTNLSILNGEKNDISYSNFAMLNVSHTLPQIFIAWANFITISAIISQTVKLKMWSFTCGFAN